jgi:hypothetical protein
MDFPRAGLGTCLVVAVVAAGGLGCGSRSSGGASSPPACREDVGDDLEVAGRTGAEGAKTGAKAAVSGVKTFGSSAVGLASGGTSEARSRWKEGSAQTKETAREGGAETKREANVPRCR